jgi:hypothetical protein
LHDFVTRKWQPARAPAAAALVWSILNVTAPGIGAFINRCTHQNGAIAVGAFHRRLGDLPLSEVAGIGDIVKLPKFVGKIESKPNCNQIQGGSRLLNTSRALIPPHIPILGESDG